MKVSTRGRYALRVMVDLAEHRDSEYTAMKEVAGRQGISLKYLERILPSLVSAGLVEGQHGKGGGYRLTREPKDYTVGEILRLTEGEIAPASCASCGGGVCTHNGDCRTKPMWDKLAILIDRYLDSVTIADLMD